MIPRSSLEEALFALALEKPAENAPCFSTPGATTKQSCGQGWTHCSPRLTKTPSVSTGRGHYPEIC